MFKFLLAASYAPKFSEINAWTMLFFNESIENMSVVFFCFFKKLKQISIDFSQLSCFVPYVAPFQCRLHTASTAPKQNIQDQSKNVRKICKMWKTCFTCEYISMDFTCSNFYMTNTLQNVSNLNFFPIWLVYATLIQVFNIFWLDIIYTCETISHLSHVAPWHNSCVRYGETF